jgi:chorismate mutase
MRNENWSNQTKENTEVLVPLREIELLDRLTSLNQGPMTEEMVLHIFQEIIDTLKELQNNLNKSN